MEEEIFEQFNKIERKLELIQAEYEGINSSLTLLRRWFKELEVRLDDHTGKLNELWLTRKEEGGLKWQ